MTQSDRANLIGSSAIKVPVKAATTAAITLSGEQTVDGISCVTGDRVLVKNQASSIANGIYTVDSGDWSRATDFDGAFDAVKGTLVVVPSGTTNGPTFWQVTTENPFVIGTDAIDFALRVTSLAGVSAFIQTLLDDTTQAIARSTLGFPNTGVPVTETAVQVLTGKSLTSPALTTPTLTTPTMSNPVLSGTATGTYTLGGTATITNPTITAATFGMGTGSGTSSNTGVAHIDTTVVGNVGGGTDDLMSYTLPANSLSANGKGIYVKAWGNINNNANAKTVGITIGAASVEAFVMTASQNGRWTCEFTLIRTASNQQHMRTEMRETIPGTLTATKSAQNNGNPNQTDTSAMTIKFTGAGTADNDIQQEGMLIMSLN